MEERVYLEGRTSKASHDDLILPTKSKVTEQYIDLREIHDFGINFNKRGRKEAEAEPNAQELVEAA